MKIKIIDLLNKIANKEEMPEMIIFNHVIWKYKKETQDYYSANTNEPLLNDYSSLVIWIMKHLNTEVEIIEEGKTMKEFDFDYNVEKLADIIIQMKQKINELVKEINKIKEN